MSGQDVQNASSKLAHCTMNEKYKICLIGSGNWGSAIAKIVGANVQKFDYFDNEVKMYVYEEIVNGKKLTEIINTEHENVKYLPGHKLPANVVACPDIVQTAQDADILIFVLPHKFVEPTCKPLIGKLKKKAYGLSLIKGFGEKPGGGIILVSEMISNLLDINCAVLMGANLANEVAEDKFCETTIGIKCPGFGKILKNAIQTDNFRVSVVKDTHTVEICGALKNIVACAAGFSDGLGLGDNSKAAVIRIGLKEMIRFCRLFYPADHEQKTFFESCGVADLITTCYGGRNRRLSEQFVKQNKSFDVLEAEMLNGQKLQGPQTADEVAVLLKEKNVEDQFPLFIAVNLIAKKQLAVEKLLDYLRKEPEDY